jgi:hypothetical protein
MPVTGEDAFPDRAPIQWESHMRATIIDGMNLSVVREQSDDMPVQLHDCTAGRFHLSQGSCHYKVSRFVHKNLPS